MIETTYFSVSPARYVRHVAMIWAARWGWTIVLPVVACVIAGMWRPIWFVAAVALLLVVYPGVLALLYFNYALRPEAAMAVLPHRVVIGADGLTIDYAPSEDYHAPKPRHIPMSEVAMVEDAGTVLLVHLRSSVYDIIELPDSCFVDGDMSEALKILSPS